MLRWEPSNFTGEELVSLETAFTKMDSDGNGTLSGVGITFRISASLTLSVTRLVTFYNSQEEVKSSLREMMPEDEVVSIQNKQTLRNPLNQMKLTRIHNVLSVGEPSGRYGRQWGRGN